VALGMDASVGAQHRRQPATLLDRRRRDRRRSDEYASVQPELAGELALATLDKLNRGVILLDADGQVRFLNRAAEVMVAGKSGLRLRRRRLQFEDIDATAALDVFLAKGTGAAECGSLVLRVDGPRLRSPYPVLVSPLATRSGRNDHGAGYCVFIYEPNGGQKPLPVPVLQSLYHLTAAEARLVNALFGGQSLTESARACDVSINTAKSVLKRIFAKCAVRSQTELLLLLSLGPRTL